MALLKHHDFPHTSTFTVCSALSSQLGSSLSKHSPIISWGKWDSSSHFPSGMKIKGCCSCTTHQTLHNWQRLPWLWLKGSWEKSSGWEELSIINKSHACTQRAVLTQTKHFPPSEVSALCSVNRKITCPTLQTKMLCSKGARIITYSNYHSLSLENSPSGQIHLYFCPCTWTSTKQGFAKHLLYCLCFILKGSFTPNYLSTILEVALQWFMQCTRIPSSTWIPLQPEDSSSQDAGMLLSTVTPPAWTAHDLDEAFHSSQLLHCDFTEAASVWQCLQEGNPVGDKFLPTATLHGIRFQQFAASSSYRFTDVSTTFSNCPITCKLGPLERTDDFGYNPLHRCRDTLRKG